ncbi:hypothetical protein PV326_006417, partial [Microctonus aethiopoides]
MAIWMCRIPIGKPKTVQNIITVTEIVGDIITVFFRFMKSGFMFASELYCRQGKPNSMDTSFHIGNETDYGLIYCFIKSSNCDCETRFCENKCNAQYFSIIKKYDALPLVVNDSFHNCSHINECRITNDIMAIDVNNLSFVCFYIKISTDNMPFIIEP